MKDAFELNAMDRLRWLVCKQFGVLPQGDRPSEEDCLRCGINMVLDRQLAQGFAQGSSFDPERFETLKGGGL